MTTTNEAMIALTKDLIAVQSKVQAAGKNKENPQFKSKYADLGAVWAACRELLAEHGFAVTHTFDETDGTVLICIATLMHVSGATITSKLTLRPQRTDPQGMGSAITYARRYTLASLVGIVVDDDDDANAASRRPAQQQAAPALSPIQVRRKNLARLLKDYSGDNKEELVGECQIALSTGNLDDALIDSVITRMGLQPNAL